MTEKICAHCGKKLSEFNKTMMLGCPYCYEQFAAEINKVILNVQSGVKHVGKSPYLAQRKEQLLRSYDMLLEQRQQYTLQNDMVKVKAINQKINAVKHEIEKFGVTL